MDVFSRPDGSFGFDEFRKDPEDMGVWTPVANYSAVAYDTAEAALAEATLRVWWLGEVL